MSAILEGLQNFWTGYCKSEERYYEQRMICEWGKVPPSSVKIQDVPVSADSKDTIHCISLATGNKMPYVLLPGYASSGGMYYKLMKGLGERFDLHFVDMRGMGGYYSV